MKLYDLRNMTFADVSAWFYKRNCTGSWDGVNPLECMCILSYVSRQANLELGWKRIFKKKVSQKREEIWKRVWDEIEDDFESIERMVEEYETEGN